jgi:hypothetical protein
MQKQFYHPDSTVKDVSDRKEEKYTFKDVLVIVFAWAIALSLVAVAILKIKFFYR